MKAAPRQIERLLSAPDPGLAVFVVYGPDHGLVRERARKVAQSVIADLDDPFAVSRLNEDDLKADPASLADAMAALSMIGGPRLVRLRLSGDSAPTAGWLADFEAGKAPAEAVLVIEAGDLKKGSKLRKTAEASARMMAIACYADDTRGLMALAEQSLAGQGLTLAPDAKPLLGQILDGDRQLARSELDKLITYKGLKDQRAPGEDTVSGDDIAAVCAAGAEAALDQVVDPALLGEAGAADRGYARALESGISPVGVLRALQRKIDQIDVFNTAPGDAAALARTGAPRFGPPADRFKRTARLWSGRRLDHARRLAFDTERAVKRSGAPAEALVGALLLRIARGARAGR